MIAQLDTALNTSTYSSQSLALLLISHASWLVLYLMVFRNIRKHGVVEIPPAAVASNFAYVTVWGLLRSPDLGTPFTWINRVAILIEGAVFVYVLFNGAKHIRLPEIRRWFKAGMVLSYVSWLAMLATFANQNYDVPSGLVSFFIVSLVMSAMYVLVELSEIDADQYSLTAGWAKLSANGSASIFCVMLYSNNRFLLTLCAITVVLDVMYLLVFRQRRDAQPSRAPA